MKSSFFKKLAITATVFLLCSALYLPFTKARAFDGVRVVRISMADAYTYLPSPAKDPELARQMIDSIKKVPPGVLERLINLNVKLYLIDGPITGQPEYAHLKGLTPPGWEHTGLTWDSVPGIGGTNPAMVRMDCSSLDPERDAIYLELHETGHMIDVFGRWGVKFSDDKDFINAWNLERQLFSTNSYFDDRMEYFAEFFSYIILSQAFGRSAAAQNVARAPLTYEFFKKAGLTAKTAPDLSVLKDASDEYSTVIVSNTPFASEYPCGKWTDRQQIKNLSDRATRYLSDEGLYVSFWVINYGMKTDKPFDVQILANGKAIKTLSCGPLEEGEAAIFTDIPIGSLPEGAQELAVVADPGDVTKDSDSHNNRAGLTFSIVGGDRANTIEMTVGNPRFTLNGLESYIESADTSPIIIDSRVMVPIKTIAESLGGFAVWNGKERRVTVRLKGNEAILSVGKSEFSVDAEPYTLDVVPQIIGGRMYIPIRGVMEALGAEVHWDNAAKSVAISY